jgi:phosphoesterase RecJ-like protein
MFDELGLVSADLEGIVDALGLVEGVEVAVLFIERDPGKVKLSFRSRGKVDVAALAQRLTPMGGGHRKASGATVVGGLADVRARVQAELTDALGAA